LGITIAISRYMQIEAEDFYGRVAFPQVSDVGDIVSTAKPFRRSFVIRRSIMRLLLLPVLGLALLGQSFNGTIAGVVTDARAVIPNAVTVRNEGTEVQRRDPCAPPTNAITCENSKLGNPRSDWDIDGDGDPSIQGFATEISVNRGEIVHFKIKTDAAAYSLEIYRVGYYGGLGARKVATVSPSARLPQTQPNCLYEADTLLVDCGNWAESASWTVPAGATSGVYLAKLNRGPHSSLTGTSHAIFIVRDDPGASDILFQTSDTTWQAYNSYGLSDQSSSLYTGATKVSYNRPFNTRGQHGVYASNASWFFAYEYPMVRWLEANGYDVSYFTGVDTDRMGTRILGHKVFLSVGHDEYWSANQRANVEAARTARVHLAFFSGNEVYWKTRWEPSIDGSGTPYRTLVCYKETNGDISGARTDPDPAWTGTWRDPSFSPPSDGGRPANGLTGTNYMVEVDFRAMAVPWDDGKMRLWRNTYVAGLSQGVAALLGSGCNCTLGHEWDEDSDNGFRPPGLIRASTTTTPSLDGGGIVSNPMFYLLDHGSTYRPHVATHHVTLYRSPPTLSGALVFGAGTIAWSWALDGNHDHDQEFNVQPSTPELAIQQATVNLFADMCDATGQHCIQPRTLQAGLVPATASTDSTPPTSAITSPTNGGTVAMGAVVSITGTAVERGGGRVGGVEVSVDGGRTWHPAIGRTVWSYSWKPTLLGTTMIQSRAVDDTGNLENPARSVNVTVVPRTSGILLFYNQTNGNNAIGRVDNSGNYLNLSAGGFVTGWTHIVTGINNILFFYNASTGFAWTGRLDDAGNYSDVGVVPDCCSPGWTHIVAGSNNVVLFYNSITGYTALGRLDDDGSFRSLSTRRLSAGWTNIVAGVNNVFLFYNRDTGQGATAKLGIPAGNYVDLGEITGLAPGWTNIVAGVNNVLLFFKANPGNAMSARLDDTGTLTYLRNPLWNADLAWTSISAGVKANVLLFYHAPSGTVATGTLDANGNYVHLKNLGGFSPGWTHVIGP
jgi:hypothetical protein